MEHRFYSKTNRQQQMIQLWVVLGAIIVVFVSFLISWLIGFYLLGVLVFVIVISILAPFLDVPSLIKSGQLRYHSQLFLSEKPHRGVIKIHGGTLFDYVFVIDRSLTGSQRTSLIMQQYMEGLLNLIDTYEHNESDNVIIRGTSYIVNERTAQRVGFKVVNTDNIQKMILIYNYFNILITYSIAKGKLSFPKILATKTFEANIKDLMEHRAFITALLQKLKGADTKEEE